MSDMGICEYCKYKDEAAEPCLKCCVEKGNFEIDMSVNNARVEVVLIEKVEELIRAFVKEWNMENHKRISYVASDELISYIRVHIKDHNSDLKEMENANE